MQIIKASCEIAVDGGHNITKFDKVQPFDANL